MTNDEPDPEPSASPGGDGGDMSARTTDESAGGPGDKEVPWGGNRFESGERNGSLGIQALLYGFVGGFFFVVGIGYWFVTYEVTGTVMLLLVGMLMATIAAYLAYPRRPEPRTITGTVPRERGDGASDLGEEAGVTRATTVEVAIPGPAEHWFPHGSLWPFGIGVGVLLFANGLLLGIWLWLPALAFLAFTLLGFTLEGRQRS